jgi:pyochelin synthetase
MHMTASQLVAELALQNVQLWREGDELRVRAPRGVLTPELHAKLIECKAAVLELLREQDDAATTTSALPEVVPDPEHRYDPFLLTDIQQAFWIGRESAFELGNVACHAYYEVDTEGLDLARFNLALWRLIERHDMLRAIVLPNGHQQVLREVPQYQIEELDLRGHDSAAASALLDSVRTRMSHQVLASDRWPLFEIRASRLDETRLRLHFSFDILIADVWSLQILFKEWSYLYDNPERSLPALELSFRDCVLAEPRLRETEAYRLSQQYWAARLPTLPPAPDLPLAVDPGSVTKPSFKRRSARLEPSDWGRIKERAAECGITPSGALLAAFSETLNLWSKSARFAINVTLLNRLPLHPHVNQVVGDFTTSVPVAVDHSQVESFAARAERIQTQLLEDIEHRFISGVQIVRDLARVQGRKPGATMPIVFTSLLSQGAARTRTDQTLWMGDVVYGISQTPQVWLDHQVMEEAGALVFNWDCVDELFPDGLIQDMFDSYCSLLERLCAIGGRWIQPIRDLLPPAQLSQRAAINSTRAPMPRVMLHNLFESQAILQPDHAAVVAEDRSLTYSELQCRTTCLAAMLRQEGARPNDLVAVVMEKGWEQVVAVMAILKSGAAYVPIDPALPKERIWHLLERSEVKIALTQSRIERRLEWPPDIARISVDTEPANPTGVDLLDDVQKPEDLAYVIYTSGSTGLPKGVMINHVGAVNTILDLNRRFNVRPTDRVFAISSLGFDLSVYDIFGTLAAGGTIVLPSSSARRDPRIWLELIEREQVTIWNSVPALMEMLVEYGNQRMDKLAESLRLVLLSGDWIPVTLPERIARISDSAKVISLGGATEASIWSILYPIQHVTPSMPSIPYGRPMDNQRFHVLSKTMEPRPIWVSGDLYISGAGLALGYWQDHDRTDASFLTHPVTGERMYRTGDLGRYLPDGNIEFLGREDSQVKVLGYRIELGEIEAALLKHPSVRSTAVLGVGERESKRLIAFVAVDNLTPPSPEELRRFARKKLPAYMVPTKFVVLDSLPLTPNGKVDRSILPDLIDMPQQSGEPCAKPEEAIEKVIAATVAGVLKLDNISSEADLLQLGANSIDMIKIGGLLEQKLKIRPRFEEFYSNATIRSLSSSYSRRLESEREAIRVVPIGAYREAAERASLACEEGEL